MLPEFGGVSFAPDSILRNSWGYSNADTADDFRDRLCAILIAKLPVETIRALIEGRSRQLP